jgi:hypothetical protein
MNKIFEFIVDCYFTYIFEPVSIVIATIIDMINPDLSKEDLLTCTILFTLFFTLEIPFLFLFFWIVL